MDNFASDKVSVFPSTIRTVQPGNEHSQRMITEENVANILKKACSKTRYVIGRDDNWVEFVYDGYYFRVNVSGQSGNLYVEPVFDSGILQGDSGGTNSKFLGLQYKTSITSTDVGYLHIWTDSTNSHIPEESQIMYDSEKISDIDCGEIE